MKTVWRFYDELWGAERYVWNAFSSAGFPSRPVGFVTLFVGAVIVGIAYLVTRLALAVLPAGEANAWVAKHTFNICVGAAIVFIVLGVVRLMTRVDMVDTTAASNG